MELPTNDTMPPRQDCHTSQKEAVASYRLMYHLIFSARCNIYIFHLCYDASVRLSVRRSVTFVHCGHRVQWIPDIFACLDCWMSLHVTPLSENNNAVDGGPLLLAPLAVDTNDATIHYGSSLICSICHCICCKRACIICRPQINQVKFESQHDICANNQQVTVCVAMCCKYCLQQLLPGEYTHGMQSDIVDFVWGCATQSIGISRYTCIN